MSQPDPSEPAAPSPIEREVSVEPDVTLRVRAWEPDALASAGAPAARSSARVSGGAAASSPAPVPFVLLHGIASNARIWDGVAARLAAAGHRAFALDLRGHGRSDRPDRGYDGATFASDLRAVVAGLGLDRPVLAGQSLGAEVVLEAAATNPHLARAIVLLEGGVADARRQFDSWEHLRSGVALPPVAGIPAPGVEGFLRASNPGWSAERLAAAMASFDRLTDGTLAWRLTPPRFEALLRSMWDRRLEDLWAAIRVPTLAILCDTGDARWTAAKREAAGAMAQIVPGLRVAWFTAEHDVHAAEPEAVAGLLLDAVSGGFFGGQGETAG